ncbi:protein kinase domain-containing protein [Azohydromonas aeria]|uniref:protein kinase domain-containing protein n=1 Tax=Azohydromonas aeria TaxID=2590212 RepID=UPI0012F87A1A|nr:protein kinase [Azohydromonas aeria]
MASPDGSPVPTPSPAAGSAGSLAATRPPQRPASADDDDDEATRLIPAPRPPGVGASATASPGLPPQPLRDAGATLPGGPPAGEAQVRQVGRYEIRERLGRGGMATVFRAHDPSIGRDVAVKFLHASLSENEEVRARFLREARAAGRLSHPNIVIVYDVGEIEGRPYMAMELLQGQPLNALMDQGEPLEVREALVLGIQLALALDYAHAHGIVHRDIKPSNIVRLQGAQTIKVTDFGIAHMDTVGDEQRTRVGDILGTPQYMSPEQTQGEKLDGRSDLFSAGIVLYQMLAGQRPFTGDSLVSLALQIAKEDPPPLERLRPELPPGLARVVQRCLAKAPQQRYQSGRELAEALGKVLAAMDEAAQQRDKPRIVPLRVKWAASMALVVAVVMGLAATVVTQRQAAAMRGQAMDVGAALARLIAVQNAAPALAEEWVTVEVALQEAMRTRDLHDVAVLDRAGVVRASSQGALLNQPYRAPAGQALGRRGDAVQVTRYQDGTASVLGFEAPITFQGKAVGRVVLGLPEAPLLAVVRLSLAWMALLVLVTVVAVAAAMYFLAERLARPIRRLGSALDEIAAGHVEHRIGEQRKDEFGLLFAAFDRMAQALQSRLGPPERTP